MNYLLSDDGLRALDAFCMADSIFAFDYDGTLAPIVDDPERAAMRAETGHYFTAVSKRAAIALISGRAKHDVGRFISQASLVDFVIGNHGLEGFPGGTSSLDQAETACKLWTASLSSLLDVKGVRVENKTFSLAVHYRGAFDRRAAKAKILEAASLLTPSPRIVMGKCVVNLITAGAPHKGVALLEAMLHSGCRSAVYFGDDDNDEDVFGLSDESILTVRIGKSDHSAALFYLKSQSEMDRVLQHIESVLTRCGKAEKSPLPARSGYDYSK